MPRLTDQIINQRVRAAMTPPMQVGINRSKVSPQAFENLLQKARQKGVAKPEIKLSDEQKADLKAKTMSIPRQETW